MDFSRFQEEFSDFFSSDGAVSSVPSAVLNTFIPGYGIISQLIFRSLGIGA
jgi:chaperone BCS1